MASDSKYPRWRKKYDPFNGMEKPPFLDTKNIVSGAKKQSPADKKTPAETTPSALDELNRGENLINNGKPTVSDAGINQRGLAGASKTGATSRQAGFKTNVHKKTPTGKNGTKKGKGLFKKVGPLGAITFLIFGGGVFFYAAQSILAPHLSNLYTQATDLQYISYNLRNPYLMSFMLDGGNQIKIDGFTTRYTRFSSKLQDNLVKNGIKVGHLNADGVFEEGQSALGYSTVLQYQGKNIDASSFQDSFASDANFREAYYSAKLGRSSNYYDSTADDFFGGSAGTTDRNILKDLSGSSDSETTQMEVENAINNVATGSAGTINTIDSEEDPKTNKTTNTPNGEDINTDSIVGGTPEVQARTLVNSLASKVSAAGVPICSALRLANMAAIASSVIQIGRSMAYFLGLIESVNKMMAGDGNTSGVNEVLNFLTRQTTSTVDYVNESGQTVSKTVSGSPLESAGAKLILGQTPSTASEVEPYALDGITKSVTTIAVWSGATTAVCSGILASSAILSLMKYAVPGGSIAMFTLGAVFRVVGGIAMTAAVAAIINAIIPRVAKMFTTDVFETYTGIPAGELFSQGAAATNFSLATKGSAYMPASEEYVKTQNRNLTLALAQEAEVDRVRRSPFDTSSPNTFLGSILSKFSYLSYSNPLVNGAAGVTRVVGSSIRSLIPGASAYDQDLMYTSQNSECTYLKGATCDMYGHAIPVSDYSTKDIRPDDPKYQAVILPNLNNDGSIKDNTELTKFINFCANRESMWGVMDANILNALKTPGGIVLNNIKVVNEIVDVVDAVKDVINQKWATGEYCMASSENPRWDSEFKYYQRYIEDSRFLHSIGNSSSNSNNADNTDSDDENPVLAYRKKYLEAHPLDTSFEGTLSRITGFSMDDVAFLLEYINYSNQLANYDPSTKAKFGPYHEPEEVKPTFINNPTPSINILAAVSESIFIDRRNYTV